jgi:hypothetical protein
MSSLLPPAPAPKKGYTCYYDYTKKEWIFVKSGNNQIFYG